MSLSSWKTDRSLGKVPCQNDRDSWSCPNMKEKENDWSMEYEHYECKICGRKHKLDYDEMR